MYIQIVITASMTITCFIESLVTMKIYLAVPILSELQERVLSLSLLLTDSTAGLGETTLSREIGGMGRAVMLSFHLSINLKWLFPRQNQHEVWQKHGRFFAVQRKRFGLQNKQKTTVGKKRDLNISIKYWIGGTFYWPKNIKKGAEYVPWNSSRGYWHKVKSKQKTIFSQIQ